MSQHEKQGTRVLGAARPGHCMHAKLKSLSEATSGLSYIGSRDMEGADIYRARDAEKTPSNPSRDPAASPRPAAIRRPGEGAPGLDFREPSAALGSKLQAIRLPSPHQVLHQ